MRYVLAATVVFASLTLEARTLCDKFQSRPELQTVVHMLAKKLSYTADELCQNPRIADIQDEQRRFYYADTDRYETHTVITLHYSEYSCEYHWNAGRSDWMKQYCYSTW